MATDQNSDHLQKPGHVRVTFRHLGLQFGILPHHLFHVLGHFALLPSQPLQLLKFLVHEACMNGLPLDVMCIIIIIIIIIITIIVTITILMSLAITRFSARNLSSS